jgi:site-specific recombinase XerD
LLREQASELLNAPDPCTLKGKRDRAILALLIGCGLRRAELLSLEIDQIQQREGRWVIPTCWARASASAPSPSPPR